ncbi:hypothetical protein QT711_01730 [Sporosarcina saromensis]|uniref:Copper amine oxidase N-terminal domain-containing protein n=1 Tax=Sporosarcina saromensis TaxID=359365 RepID=A0ABU4G4J4_9BACL|nr:hypothetical protein [Sporosarcina saromensis]MDW0111888.1 hypothetical protein [Sporosarcina saromensis]
MKNSSRIVGLLLLVNIALVYMHYSLMADANESTEYPQTYNQEIEVINRADTILVKQHFTNLHPGRHELVFPKNVQNIACYKEKDTSCSRLNDNSTAFIEGEQSAQSISYEIPTDSKYGASLFIKDPFVTIRNETTNKSLLHITDEQGIGGMWLSGLKLIGKKHTELINYAFYKGNGPITELYWQKDPLPVTHQAKELTIYGQKLDKEQGEQLANSLAEVKTDHLDVIIGTSKKHVQGDRIVVVDELNTTSIHQLYEKAIRTQYALPREELVTAQLTTSILLDEPVGATRSKRAYEMLKNELTKVEFDQLQLVLMNKRGGQIDAAGLDGMIGELKGMSTSFVQKNVNESFPFVFEETREIVLNGKEQEGIPVVMKGKQTLYALNALLTAMGYEVSSNERSIYVQGTQEDYRFSLRDPFYVHNEKKHTLREAPYVRIGNAYYFDEDALRRIFHLSIQKNDEQILMTSLNGGESE